jgi:HEAT repeat protein
LAALCLALAPQAGVTIDVLSRSLASEKEIERVSAVQRLALLRSKEAWLLVVGAMKDVSPRVADEAELQLAKCDDMDVIDELAGRAGAQSPDPWIAIHAVGALTGGENPSVAAFEAALKAKNDDARSIAYAGIERNAAALLAVGKVPRSIVGALEKGVQPLGRGGEAQAAALMALAALEPAKSVDWIARAESKQSPAYLCALLAIASDDRGDAAKRLFAMGAAHPDRAVRAATVEALASEPDAERVKLLVDMLAAEKNTRLFWTIDGELERLSGLSGSGKPDFWQGWVARLGPEWKPVTGTARRSESAGDTEAPKLAGMPILSGGIAILVDCSGSTWEVRADGSTVKQRLDKELEKALQALLPTARFNVVPYTDVPIPWEKRLAPATPANVAKASKFFVGCKASGKGNFWDAAMWALEDPDVDTILVLTDGAPTGGRRWNLDIMRARFLEKNRFRHVVLDAVLVHAGKSLIGKWKDWCTATGGRELTLDL